MINIFTNILTDLLPTEVEIKGIQFKIRSDLKTIIKLENIIQDNININYSALENILELFYCTKIDEYKKNYVFLLEMYSKFVEFYSLGNKMIYRKISKENPVKSIDYKLDADVIYADFIREYNIDLITQNIHWYKFLSLINGLSQKSELRKIMSIRQLDLSTLKNEEDIKNYTELQEIYKIAPENKLIKEMQEIYEKCLQSGNFGEYLVFMKENRTLMAEQDRLRGS